MTREKAEENGQRKRMKMPARAKNLIWLSQLSYQFCKKNNEELLKAVDKKIAAERKVIIKKAPMTKLLSLGKVKNQLMTRQVQALP